MAKVDLESNSVAYFDHPDQVDEPGFYLVEGDEDTTDVKVYDGGSFKVAGEDDEGNPTLATDDRGRPVLETAPEVQDTISVKHNTNPTIGDRVWGSPDGDGFVDEEPEGTVKADGGDVWITENGGEG